VRLALRDCPFTIIALSSLFSSSDFYSHSGLEAPRGTSTVRNEPGVRDITTRKYLVELLPIGTNGKDEVSQLIEELEKVQDMLGTIHDYDTTIAYTRKYLENHTEERASLSNTVKYLYKDRQKEFEQFTEFCKADLSNSEDNLFLNIMNIK